MIERKTRPTILVTGPDKWFKAGWLASSLQLWLAGAKGVYHTAKQPQLPAKIDGVIIGGGDDINPSHYGANGLAGATYDPQRDEMELAVIKLALKNGLPLLGICRGAQLINVAHGGSLHSDIRPLRSKTPNRNSLFPIKSAFVEHNSRLHGIVGAEKIRINSLHHQAVDRLGSGLNVTAVDADGFVQGIESNDDKFILGVQWHPEYMPQRSSQRSLFKHLVKATIAKRFRLSNAGT